MKELSTEEKAKRYNEAINIAKSKIKNDKDHVLYEDDVIEIFPELKENEDESIRKALLEMVNDTKGDDLWINYNVHKEDAVAWLERQWKQETINNKFKAKDWYVSEVDGKIRDATVVKQCNNDKTIVKHLIALMAKVYANTNYISYIEYEGILAWLEKQNK